LIVFACVGLFAWHWKLLAVACALLGISILVASFRLGPVVCAGCRKHINGSILWEGRLTYDERINLHAQNDLTLILCCSHCNLLYCEKCYVDLDMGKCTYCGSRGVYREGWALLCSEQASEKK
jgi:hypothetical protein